MENGFDINKFAAELAARQLGVVSKGGKNVLTKAGNQLKLRLRRTYSEYVKVTYDRFCTAKSFLVRYEPVPLYSFYIPLSIKAGKTKLRRPLARKLAETTSHSIVTGLAGSGKSMFMRHLLLNSLIDCFRVPVLVKLRELNHTRATLLEIVSEVLRENGLQTDNTYVRRALKEGHFLLLLDGLDEVAVTRREQLKREIRKLASKYPHSPLVVSSRPETDLSGWEGFTLWEMIPLSLTEARELIKRIPSDSAIKKQFLQDLKDLFEEHQSFVSNPLLLSIMLLTYGQSADIPRKRSVFFNQAYEALYERHDVRKEGFRRQRKTDLDIQDFKRVFSAFSIQTYDDSALTMSRSGSRKYLEESKHMCHLEYQVNDYLDDALQAVCLLVEDGMQLSFTHRSFQEFFAASFMADAEADIQERLIEKYGVNAGSDNMLDLLHEMKPEVVSRYFLLPGLERLRSIIGLKRKVGITHFTRYLKASYPEFKVTKDNILGIPTLEKEEKRVRLGRVVAFAIDKYGEEVGWKGYEIRPEEQAALSAKYRNTKLVLKEMSYQHPFIRKLAYSRTFFSIESLNTALKVEKLLTRRHKETDESLSALLSDS